MELGPQIKHLRIQHSERWRLLALHNFSFLLQEMCNSFVKIAVGLVFSLFKTLLPQQKLAQLQRCSVAAWNEKKRMTSTCKAWQGRLHGNKAL